MNFDARSAKLLSPVEHITIEEFPGLRLEATALRRAWTYRYRSPVDGRMRQTRLGLWPAMSLPAALVKWEGLRNARGVGEDPALLKRQTRLAQAEAVEASIQEERKRAYTVRLLCDDYLAGHVDRHRKAKGAAEVRRMFETMLAPLDVESASTLTRSQAFDLLKAH